MDKMLFAGLKVLDVGTWVAGPVSTTILADFGADVIKVEMPGTGDQYRGLAGLPTMPDADANYMWDMDGRNKRSLSLNLKTAKGMEVLHKLVADCDVYCTNQPFPMRDALHLNYADLKPLNPRMIYASLSAYGEEGPERNREGFDLVAYWGRTGLMDLVRDPEGLPAQALPGMGDHPTAVSLYAAIVTALLRREWTGEGAMVHTSLMANGIWAASCIAAAGFAGGSYTKYRQLRQTRRFPSAVYRAADERFLQFTMVRSDEELANFFALLGLPPLLEDQRFATPEARFSHSAELSERIQEKLAQKPAAEWMHLFATKAVPAVLVGQIEELLQDPQVRANNMVEAPADQPKSSREIINHPINIDGANRAGPKRAPEVGEHTEEILTNLGYSSPDIEAMQSQGIV